MQAAPLPKRIALVAATAAAIALSSCSQVELARLYYANNGTEARLDAPLPVTLKFRDANGWIIVPGRINDSPPIDFVLDTGASMLAILASAKTDALGLDMSSAKHLGAEGDVATPFGAAQRNLDIDFGPVTLVGQTALAVPLDTVLCKDGMKEPPFQGVVGHELFHRYVVEVNYDRGEVVLHDPETYEYEGDGRIVHADIDGRQPFIEADVTAPDGATYQARMHVDSGAGITASLFPQTNEKIVVPKDGKPTAACFVGGEATYVTGTSVDMSFAGSPGVSVPVQYSTGKEVIDTGQNGRLGAQFLRRYNVVFDYSRERMILEPRAEQVAARD